jgi:hypothetical protein
MAEHDLEERALSPFLNALDVGVIIIDRPGIASVAGSRRCATSS